MGKKLKKYATSQWWKVFVLIAVPLLIGAAGSYALFLSKKSQKIVQAKEQLATVSRERSLELLNFVDDQEIKAFDIATASETIDCLELLSTNSVAEVQKYNPFFERYKKVYAYKDLLLISRRGDILFSISNKKLVGIELRKKQHEGTTLAESFSRSVMTMGVDISAFAFFPPLDQSALYISIPVLKDKKFIGVLAAQINEQAVAEIISNYKNLGRTGELLLVEKKGSEYHFVVPSRNEPALSSGTLTHKSNALQRALQGMQGSGLELDYRQKQVIAIWRYLPDVAWGMITKMDLSEILEPVIRYFYAALIALFVGLALLLLGILLAVWHGLIKALQNSRVVRKVIIGGVIINCIVAGALTYSYRSTKMQRSERLEQEAGNKTNQAREAVAKQLEQVEYVANTVAEDLTAGRLNKEDIEIRIRREIQEHPDIIGFYVAYEPHSYSAGEKLFAPAIVREETGLTPQMINSFYDYTKPEQPGQSVTRWYSIPIQQGAQWVEPYIEPTTKSLVAAYSVPFYQKGNKEKPIGIVSVLYPIDKVKEIVEGLGIGKTGYAFVVSKEGYFLYHPISEYVQKEKTIFEIADALNNTDLRMIGQKGISGEKGFSHYLNEITAQYSSVYYEPIGSTGWMLAVAFIEEEVSGETATWRHYRIWILISLIVLSLFAGALISNAYAGKNLLVYSGFVALVFAVGIVTLWVSVYQGYSREYARGIPVVDKVGLHTIVDSLNRRAVSSHQSVPITIPTGIYIRSLSFPTPMQVEISAEVWQQYDTKKYPDLPQGIIFPQSTTLEVEEHYREKKGDVETVGWSVKGILSQDFDYSQYPFDFKNVEIALDHPNKTKNILLIPDFESYRLLNPETKPGINQGVKVLGYSIRKSIFSFDVAKPKVDFGIDDITATKTTLNFNIALRRNLIDAIMVFLLPLLVMLVAVYAALWFTYEDPGYEVSYRTLGAYTAVIFTLVILHRLLREKLPSGEIIYLEYFFFFTYVTIAFLLLHALLLYSKIRLRPFALKFSYILRFLYWPVEIFAWLVVTIIVFYN